MKKSFLALATSVATMKKSFSALATLVATIKKGFWALASREAAVKNHYSHLTTVLLRQSQLLLYAVFNVQQAAVCNLFLLWLRNM
jgi:hypothetical protein